MKKNESEIGYDASRSPLVRERELWEELVDQLRRDVRKGVGDEFKLGQMGLSHGGVVNTKLQRME